MSGYRAAILETHDKPVELCTPWNRQGYAIDDYIHWLVGNAPSSSLYRIWEELGATRGRRFINNDIFLHIENVHGRNSISTSDLDRLKQHILEIASESEDSVARFINSVRDFVQVDASADEVSEPRVDADQTGVSFAKTSEKMGQKVDGRILHFD